MANGDELLLLRDFLLELLGKLPGGTYWQNPLIVSALIILGSFLLAQFLQYLFAKYLEKIARKTTSKIDDLLLDRTKHPFFFLVIALGIKLALMNLGIDGLLTKLVDSGLALLFLLFLSRIVDVIIETWGMHFAKKTKTRIDEVLLPLFRKIGKVIFVVIGFMWVLHLWGIDITPYLAGVGISGLVLGLALQDSLKNVFGGISLLLDKTFRVGDRLKLESGEIGWVHDIGLRSTQLLTPDNELIHIPNGYLANSKVQNFSHPDEKVRLCVDFGVEYGTKVEKVRETVLTVLKKKEWVLKKPEPEVCFMEMGDFALKFRAFFWVDHWNKVGKKLEATELIYDALNKAKIGIPFPTQTVHVEKRHSPKSE